MTDRRVKYVVIQGMRLLLAYGYPPATAPETSGNWIRTTDADGAVEYLLGCSPRPMIFRSEERALQIIEEFHIPGAQAIPWHGPG